MSLSSRTKWNVVLGSAVIVLGIVAGFSYWGLKEFVAANHALVKSQEFLTKLEEAMGAVKDAAAVVKAYALTGDASQLGPYWIAAGEVPAKLRELGAMVPDGSTTRVEVARLERLSRGRLAIARRSVDVRRKTGDALGVIPLIDQSNVLMEEIRQVARHLHEEQSAALSERAAIVRALAWSGLIALGAPLLLALASVLGMFLTVRRAGVSGVA